jgi:hypothetical protein
MKRMAWWMSALLLASASAWGAQPNAAGKPAAGHGPKLAAVTFGVRHRVFHEFRDLHRVKLNEDFPLGDSEFSARMVQYVPDFQMDLPARKIYTLSDQPRNPAFKLIVRKNKVPQDTSWAFLKSPPHFGAHSYFAFQVLKVEFVDHAPLMPDTTHTQTSSMPSGHPSVAQKDSSAGH